MCFYNYTFKFKKKISENLLNRTNVTHDKFIKGLEKLKINTEKFCFHVPWPNSFHLKSQNNRVNMTDYTNDWFVHEN